jgi:hypothetical protein
MVVADLDQPTQVAAITFSRGRLHECYCVIKRVRIIVQISSLHTNPAIFTRAYREIISRHLAPPQPRPSKLTHWNATSS